MSSQFLRGPSQPFGRTQKVLTKQGRQAHDTKHGWSVHAESTWYTWTVTGTTTPDKKCIGRKLLLLRSPRRIQQIRNKQIREYIPGIYVDDPYIHFRPEYFHLGTRVTCRTNEAQAETPSFRTTRLRLRAVSVKKRLLPPHKIDRLGQA